jgi:hypothetical protein
VLAWRFIENSIKHVFETIVSLGRVLASEFLLQGRVNCPLIGYKSDSFDHGGDKMLASPDYKADSRQRPAGPQQIEGAAATAQPALRC